MTSDGCTIRAGSPPYRNDNADVFVPVSGRCDHMGAGDTGEYQNKVDGADHGDSNDVPRFDANGNFSSEVFFNQGHGDVCGHQGTIIIKARYDFNNNLDVSGSTTFKIVCA